MFALYSKEAHLTSHIASSSGIDNCFSFKNRCNSQNSGCVSGFVVAGVSGEAVVALTTLAHLPVVCLAMDE